MDFEQMAVEANENNLSLAKVLKKYLGDLFLSRLFDQWSGAALQGGGALFHAHGSPRTTVDLNFAYPLDHQEDSDWRKSTKMSLRSRLEDVLETIHSEEFSRVKIEGTIIDSELNKRLTRLKLRVINPFGESNVLPVEFYQVPDYTAQQKNLLTGTGQIIVESRVYITYKDALSRYGLISDVPQGIQIATSTDSFSHWCDSGLIEAFRLPHDLFFGFEKRTAGPPIANPEKALVDSIWIAEEWGASLGWLESLDWSSLNLKRMDEYAARMEIPLINDYLTRSRVM